MSKITSAFIIASGKGQRLKILSNKPKALIEIADKVLLEHTINRFINSGINTIYLIVRYNIIDFLDFIKYYNSRLKIKVKINMIVLSENTYIDSPINDLLLAFKTENINLPKDILVSYCDTITDFEVSKLIDLHFEKNSTATLLLFSNDLVYFHQKYSINNDCLIYSIKENEFVGEKKYAQGGIFIIKKNLVENCNILKKIEFSINGGPIEIAFNRKSLYGLKTDACFFMEIGTPGNFSICEKKLIDSPNLCERLFNIVE